MRGGSLFIFSCQPSSSPSPPFLFSFPSFLSLECSITWPGFPPFSLPPCSVPISLKVKEEGSFFLHFAYFCFWWLFSFLFLFSLIECLFIVFISLYHIYNN